jgi:hypothetical protein
MRREPQAAALALDDLHAATIGAGHGEGLVERRAQEPREIAVVQVVDGRVVQSREQRGLRARTFAFEQTNFLSEGGHPETRNTYDE